MDNGGGTLGGKSFASLGLLLLKVNIPLLPETRQVEEELPGLDGTLDMDTTYGPRIIELTFNLIGGQHEADYQYYLQEIARLFNTRAGVQPLILDRAPGKRWLVKYNGTLPVERIATVGTFTAPFKAFFPFSESVTDSATPLRIGQGYSIGQGLRLGGTAYSFQLDGPSKAFAVRNNGTHDAKPVIRVTGAASNITIRNATTGEEMVWAGTMAAGDKLEIDCGRYDPAKRYALPSIKKNGVNAYAQFAGIYLRLAPGDNNIVVLSSSPAATIEFLYRHTYLY